MGHYRINHSVVLPKGDRTWQQLSVDCDCLQLPLLDGVASLFSAAVCPGTLCSQAHCQRYCLAA
ncbi:hypothetical protein [Microcoleus sp. PH2017_40_RAT_O_B]|uniref:hypothetical protein n=1 Tax=Microcoleus sp. PH2017_40_RAT_O_B TaxID=2798850 RepID=UPI0025D130F7|nr:hypothetical protein [Microcoleus sp. PH2017_40_RAT_O_B]